MVEASVNGYPTGKPKRDIVPTYGMKITAGPVSRPRWLQAWAKGAADPCDRSDGLPACVRMSQPSTVGRAKPATGIPSVTRRRGVCRTISPLVARQTVTSHKRRKSRLCRIQELCTV
jgi:hypothetical protein